MHALIIGPLLPHHLLPYRSEEHYFFSSHGGVSYQCFSFSAFQELLLRQCPETNHIVTGRMPKDTGTERLVSVMEVKKFVVIISVIIYCIACYILFLLGMANKGCVPANLS